MKVNDIPRPALVGKSMTWHDSETVFNLEVEEDQSYFANGLAVHNCDDYADHGPYDPEDVPYPAHPNDSCYLSTVIPEIG